MGPQEMRKDMRACTQQHAPECAAACPVHVDARDLCRLVAEGNFTQPLERYAKAVLFPRLVGGFCTAPCEGKCAKGRAGEPIAIRALEDALSRYGAAQPLSFTPFFQLKETVAVVGGGISGLAAALFLYEKGFQVHIYEAEPRLGGRGWQLDAKRAEADFAFLQTIPWHLHLNCRVTAAPQNAPAPAAGAQGPQAPAGAASAGAPVAGASSGGPTAAGAASGGPAPAGAASADAPVAGASSGGSTAAGATAPANTTPAPAAPNAQQAAPASLPLAALLAQYDAVFVSAGTSLATGHLSDETTLQSTEEPKLFFGGPSPRAGHEPSIIHAVAAGRRAALSMDRYLKKVSLTAGRELEGPYQTQLFTYVPEETPHDARVAPTAPDRGSASAAPAPCYTKAEAVAEAKRCLNCQCLQCVRQCAYMQHFQNYPYAIILEMATHIRMIAGQRQAGPLINSCSMCGLCGEICPNHIEMPKSVHTARRYLVERGQNVAALHDFPLRDMDHSNSEAFSLWSHARGETASDYLFFPGCQLAATLPGLMLPTYRHLRAILGPRVGVGLGCCGAPAHWSGYDVPTRGGMDALIAQWQALGKPAVVTACPTCRAQMLAHCPDMDILSLWEVLAQHELPEGAGALTPTVAVQDACGSRHAPEEHAAVRRLLAAAGCPVAELPYAKDKSKCCNYGGLMTFGNPALAETALAQRLAESPHGFAVYCGACREQCQRGGKQTWHLLELLFGIPCPPVTDINEKRGNRQAVKNEFLQECREEPGEPPRETALEISPAVRETLDRRRILIEELEQVIHQANTTGRRLQNPKTKHYIAHLRLGLTTYWVEYALSETGRIRVHNAYTHRLQIVDD